MPKPGTERRPALTIDYIMMAVRRIEEPMYPPEASRRWRDPRWEFVRFLKAHPALQGLDADAAAAEIERVLRAALPDPDEIGDDEMPDPWALSEFYEAEELLEEFLHAWPRVRVPLGAAVLPRVRQLADEKPYVFPTDLPVRRTRPYFHILNIAIWLAIFGRGRFFLGVRTAADLAGVSRMRAHRVLTQIVADGWFCVTTQGEPVPGAPATEYEWRPNSWPVAVHARLYSGAIGTQGNPR